MEQELKLQMERIRDGLQKAQAELFQIEQAQAQLQARRAELERKIIAGNGALEFGEHLLRKRDDEDKISE